MATIIECDGCGKKVYANSPDADVYETLSIDNEYSEIDLCRDCYNNFRRNILHQRFNPEKKIWVGSNWDERPN